MRSKYTVRFYQDIFESAQDCILVVSGALSILEFNHAAQKLCGISKKSALKLRLDELFSSNEYLLNLTKKTLTSQSPTLCFDYEFFQEKGLCHIPVSASISPLRGSSGRLKGAVIVLRDISTLKDLEEDTKRRANMASVNHLAYVMAHEIKNPLSGIKGASQLLKYDVSKQCIKYVDLIISDVERINSIIGRLLYASSPHEPIFTDVNIHQILEDILLLQKETDPAKGIKVVQNYDPSIPFVKADKGQMHQIFLNIIKNAFESMDTGGVLSITTKVILDYHMLHKEAGRPLSMVLIEVKDSGSGIEEDNLKDIFTPFYSTKKNGSGLGLSICNKIVEEHKGKMKIVNNDDGRGVTVQIYLPLYRE